MIVGAQANQKSCVAGIADNVDGRKKAAVGHHVGSDHNTIASNLGCSFYN
ncbi:Acetyl-coenzyme A carboxylase carboxyl transferase subunit alpha [Moritella viscosa]|uniref:Acetyl-coenzyme A carboxylase carboxyl transferase subunit alpha n=1 Tax=Moritella viscosa TaxID=80854 RepID=A0ABY1HIM3_9GAMM|nr:Acetyl-coenzyme A carboxylase carboxyl transferase subunit alpha [Moritella viscosa]